MRVQLRRYRIEPGRVEQFAAEWQAVVVPLRRSLGFRVRGWVVEGDDEFVWIVEHDDEESFDAAESAYQNSDERARRQPEPTRLVVESRFDWVTAVE
jgi:hypothetical protein